MKGLECGALTALPVALGGCTVLHKITTLYLRDYHALTTLPEALRQCAARHTLKVVNFQLSVDNSRNTFIITRFPQSW